MSKNYGDKYNSIIKTARILFWKHGFKRVSIQEICHESNVSKVTFYKYFPNKLEVAKAVFDKVVEDGLQAFRKIIKADTNPQEKIKNLLLMKHEGVHDVSKEFLSDFYGDPKLGLKAHIEAKSKESWNIMLEDFKEAQQNGTFRKDLNLEFYFYITQKQTELLHDPYLQSLFDSPEELVMELTNLSVYGVSPRE